MRLCVFCMWIFAQEARRNVRGHPCGIGGEVMKARFVMHGGKAMRADQAALECGQWKTRAEFAEKVADEVGAKYRQACNQLAMDVLEIGRLRAGLVRLQNCLKWPRPESGEREDLRRIVEELLEDK
jgi:hypothetical protein